MKNSIFVVAILAMMSMTACTVNDNDPIEQVETIDMLTIYGAQNVDSSTNKIKELHLEELPGVSTKKAYNILSSIRKHQESEKHYDVKENQHGDHHDIDIIMDEVIGHKYTFTIQLHMQKDNESGIIYYKSYDADCSSKDFTWYIKGFSFSTDNTTGDNKFESPSYLYFKVLGENVEYIQVPVKITGKYCPINNKAEFSYIL